MSQNFSHTPKATDLTIAYPSDGPNAGYAVLHRTGCNHAKRGFDDSVHVGDRLNPLADDFYMVSPCAR